MNLNEEDVKKMSEVLIDVRSIVSLLKPPQKIEKRNVGAVVILIFAGLENKIF